jgi:hypothetical protein
MARNVVVAQSQCDKRVAVLYRPQHRPRSFVANAVATQMQRHERAVLLQCPSKQLSTNSCLATSTPPASALLVANRMSTRCLLRHLRRLEQHNSTCPFCAVAPTHPHTGVLSNKRICTTTLH